MLTRINKLLKGKEPATVLLLGALGGYFLRPSIEKLTSNNQGTIGVPVEQGKNTAMLIAGALLLFFLLDKEEDTEEDDE